MNCFVNNIFNRCWLFSSFPKGGLFLVAVPVYHPGFFCTAAPLLVLICGVFPFAVSGTHIASSAGFPSTLVTHSSSLCGAHRALDLGQGVWWNCCFHDLLIHGSRKLLLVAQKRDLGVFLNNNQTAV